MAPSHQTVPGPLSHSRGNLQAAKPSSWQSTAARLPCHQLPKVQPMPGRRPRAVMTSTGKSLCLCGVNVYAVARGDLMRVLHHVCEFGGVTGAHLSVRLMAQAIFICREEWPLHDPIVNHFVWYVGCQLSTCFTAMRHIRGSRIRPVITPQQLTTCSADLR